MKWIDSLNSSLEKSAEWTGKNFKSVASVLGVLLVVGVVWATINYTQKSKASKAMAAYAPLERDFLDWKNPEPPKKDDKKEEAQKPVSKVDPQQLFTRMIDFIQTQGDVPASELTALMASEVAVQLEPNKTEELLKVMEKTFKRGSRLMDGLSQMKQGDLLANEDHCDQALSQWKEVLSNKSLVYLHDVVRLKSGLCLEKLSKFSEAEASYDQIIQGAMNQKNMDQQTLMAKQNEWAVKEAQKLKRALKWSQKQPSS